MLGRWSTWTPLPSSAFVFTTPKVITSGWQLGGYIFLSVYLLFHNFFSKKTNVFCHNFFPRRQKEGHLPWRSVRSKHFLPPCLASLHRQTPDSPLANRVNQNVGWAVSEREAPGSCEDCEDRMRRQCSPAGACLFACLFQAFITMGHFTQDDQ